jgi:hypothetical protein
VGQSKQGVHVMVRAKSNPSFKRTALMLGPLVELLYGVWHQSRRLTLR